MKYTFARSNTRKILLLPLYIGVGVLAWIFPRSRKVWVFGREAGIGDGPLAVLEVLRRARSDLTLIWIAQNNNDLNLAAKMQITCYKKNSFRGMMATLRARYIIISIGFGDVCRIMVPGAFVVQLWHGAPLKKINLDTPISQKTNNKVVDLVMGPIYRKAFKLSSKLIKVFIASSPITVPRLASAFSVPENKIHVTGDPRCDILYEGNNLQNISRARHLLELTWNRKLPSRLVLYAPTWRDGNENPALPSGEEFLALQHLAEQLDIFFVIRSHPRGYNLDRLNIEYSKDGSRVLFLPSSDINEINKVLPAFDMLISDYSAIAMDYSLLERPILFFSPDVDKYIKERGLYEDYVTFTGGHWDVTWMSLLENIERVMTIEAIRQHFVEKVSRQIKHRYQTYDDGKNTIRVLKLLDISVS